MSTVTDAHRVWIAEAVAAPFCTQRRIPTLSRAKTVAVPLPDFFRDLPVDAKPASAPDPVGTPVAEV